MIKNNRKDAFTFEKEQIFDLHSVPFHLRWEEGAFFKFSLIRPALNWDPPLNKTRIWSLKK